MEDAERRDLKEALKNSAATSSAALMGVVAICNELVKARIFDLDAADRIGSFMLASTRQIDLQPEARAVVESSISSHFDRLRSRHG